MKISNKEILFMNAFERISGVNPRDCLVGDKVISFLVRKKDVGKAIGKNALNIKNFKKRMNKQIEVFEYSDSVEEFIKKALYKIKFEDIKIQENDGKKVVSMVLDSENRRKLLGISPRLKRVKEIAKRNYKVYDVKVR